MYSTTHDILSINDTIIILIIMHLLEGYVPISTCFTSFRPSLMGPILPACAPTAVVVSCYMHLVYSQYDTWYEYGVHVS